MAPVKDRFEVQVASCGPSGGTHLGDELSNIDPFARAHSNGFQMVVGGDQAVAVVNLHPVAPAPGVPSGGADHSRIGGINFRSARRGIVLAEVEIARGPGQGTHPETEGRAGYEQFKWRPEEAGGGPAQARGPHRQRLGTFPGVTAHCRAGKGNQGLWSGDDRSWQTTGANNAGRHFILPRGQRRSRTRISRRGSPAGRASCRASPFLRASREVQGPDGEGKGTRSREGAHEGTIKTMRLGVLIWFPVIPQKTDSRT
jgi:hypothetical protein